MKLRTLFNWPQRDNHWPAQQIAIRVTDGRVPRHCYGLTIQADGNFRLFSPESTLPKVKQHASYLVNPGPYTLRFTPNSHVPRIGMECTVSLQCDDQQLALALLAWDKPLLTLADMSEILCQLGGPTLLQPGMTQQEIDQPGSVRENFAQNVKLYGLRCSQLQRIRLAPQATVSQSTSDPTPTVQQAEVSIESLTQQWRRELPYFNKHLYQLRIHSTDEQHYQHLTRWEQRLQLCQQILTSGVLTLNPQIAAQQRHLLRDLSVRLYNLNEKPLAAAEQDRLDALLSGLEQLVDVRR